jgi:phenylacetate-coenzyme A ligase PaaK-like adenylate-forming protein
MRPFTARELWLNTAYIAGNFPAFRLRPWAPRRLLHAYQLRKLRALVAHAYENVPLYAEKYRRAGVRPADLRTLDDLSRFPTVSKDEVLAAWPDGALSRGLVLADCLVSKSSGSTGQVLHVVHRASAVGIQGLAHHRLFAQYAPYRPWDRLVYVYTSEYPARSLFGTYPMTLVPTLTPTPELCARILRLEPTFLACYPSHLRAIADELGPRRARALRLRAISVSSEPSSQAERDDLARVFGCGVFDEYSTEELTRVASQCRHGSYHVFEDVALCEIVDPRGDAPVPAGERGEVVGTYLHNLAMPFIRYRQGDLASLGVGDCPCGRRFRILRDLAGRKLDAFELPSGRVLTSGWLLDATYSFLLDVGADLAAFRLVQLERGRVRIEIVPGRRFEEAMKDRIRVRFAELVGEPLAVEVAVLPRIVPSAAGKHQPVVSLCGRSRTPAEARS